jgi:hypothetical protein
MEDDSGKRKVGFTEWQVAAESFVCARGTVARLRMMENSGSDNACSSQNCTRQTTVE